MKPHTSKDYEIFTQALHQQIINEQGYNDIEVRHDVKFEGKSGAIHQIDVCWTIDIAGVRQLFCVECKKWKSRVKKEHVAGFIAKLADIGSARGIFVTTIGYQVGATRLAQHNGITLISAVYDLKQHEATLEFLNPRLYNLTVSFEEVPAHIHAEIESISKQDVNDTEIDLYDSENSCVGKLSELISSFSHEQDGHYKEDISDTFIRILDDLVRVTTIEYDYKRNPIGMPLKSTYEVAHATGRYIFDERDISAMLNSHRVIT